MTNELEKQHGHSMLFARFTWAMIGPVALLSILIPIMKSASWVTPWDVVYASLVGLMLMARHFEQKSGEATTLYNEPSTWAHYQSYRTKLLIVAFLLWLGAKLVGEYFVV
jgi:hypothetical protein